MIVAVVGATPWVKDKLIDMRKKEIWNCVLNLLEPVALVILLLVVSAYLINDSYNPFLYFRF